MKILLLVREDNACDYHRIMNPFRTLTLEDGERLVIKQSNDTIRKSDFKHADLVICNRNPFVDLDFLLEMKEEFKFKLWVDIDDIWELYKHHHLYQAWSLSNTTFLMIKSMAAADIVTVTNLRLLRKVLTINDKVKVIPNAVPIGFEQFTPDKTESTRVRFMYAGGPSHYYDLKSIEKLFDKLSGNLNIYAKTEFIMAGYDPNYANKDLHKMWSILKKAPRHSYRPGLPLKSYMEHYNHADIAVSPLEGNDFNTYKSNLKIVEAGCMRMPIIVSRMYPFLEDKEMENSGVIFCETSEDWYKACRMFMENPQLIIPMGEKLYEYVKKKYNLLEVNQLRRDIINSFK